MGERHPLLQIIHVSDLHVGDGYDDKAAIAKFERTLRGRLRDVIEHLDLFGWHEGTLTSDVTAIHAFEDFLTGLRRDDTQWFPATKANDVPHTWLLDTGDLTTFGDAGSLDLARSRLEKWSSLLSPCETRILFGNHDAWPGTLPFLITGADSTARIEEQKNVIANWPTLRQEKWLEPLSFEHHGAKVRIELYGLNSVLFEKWDNTRAIGRIGMDDIDELVKKIDARRKESDARAYRILATHHPVSFPYEPAEIAVGGQSIAVKVLEDAKNVAKRLNRQKGPYGSPSIHLFLAGHTHAAHPGKGLQHTVMEIYQADLGHRQLQLVIGPLMLVRAIAAVKAGKASRAIVKNRDDFSDDSIFAATRQFQVLRFYQDSDQPLGLILERRVLAYEPGASGYKSIPEKRSETVVLF